MLNEKDTYACCEIDNVYQVNVQQSSLDMAY